MVFIRIIKCPDPFNFAAFNLLFLEFSLYQGLIGICAILEKRLFCVVLSDPVMLAQKIFKRNLINWSNLTGSNRLSEHEDKFYFFLFRDKMLISF